ncbi:MAG: extracellular endoglucanase precursor [Labilithrix sp.]|nr:extracellular endoglucanase precursor [Labilithrix sp.]
MLRAAGPLTGLSFVARVACLVSLAPLAITGCSSDGASGASGSSGSEASSGSSGSSGSRESTFSSVQHEGIATFYDATGDGSCSFGTSSDLDVAAFDFPDFAKSASCGTCYSVSGPKGAVTVRIVDSCPGCADHHLDLSASAFAKIADPDDGRVAITYQAVACKVRGPMKYQYKDGSHQYWTAIQIRNHKLPVAKLEAKKGGAWEELARSDYNYFIDAKGIKDDPIALRITAADGQVVEDSIPGAKDNGGRELTGTVQFE